MNLLKKLIFWLFFIFLWKVDEKFHKMWVSVNSTDKVSDGWIKNLRFKPRLHKKSIGVLIW